MKKKGKVNPYELKGKELTSRMIDLMGIRESVTPSNYSIELTKLGPNGKAYAIIRENHEYYIKESDKTKDLVLEDFKYIGGLQNKKSNAYPSYAKAIKQLNLKFLSLNETLGIKERVNVFENDNILLEHHPYKADQKLSATKGMGDGQEYVVNKKGEKLDYEAKEGKESGVFGDNVADKDTDKEWVEVKDSDMVDTLSENEAAIDDMINGDDEIVETTENKITPKYSIEKAINEMDDIIDSLVDTDVRLSEILESLDKNDKEFLLSALKKKD